MTNYAACCCQPDEAFGFRIEVRSELKLQAVDTFKLPGIDRFRTVTTDFTNVIRTRYERSLFRTRAVDTGSFLSGFRNQDDDNGFFDHREFSDYLDLNDDSGQTHPSGDPIFRTAGQATFTSSLSTAGPPNYFPNNDCVVGPNTELVAIRTIGGWGLPNTDFDDHPGATYTITREVEPDPFGQSSGVFEERNAPIGNGGILWDIRNGSGGLAGFSVGSNAPRLYELIGELPVESIIDLIDLGMSTGVIRQNLTDITDINLVPEFLCVIDGRSISRQDVWNFDDAYRCQASRGREIHHRYTLRNLTSGIIEREFEVTATRDQEIVSLVPVYA